MRTVLQERRRFARSEFPSRVAINFLQPHAFVGADNVNVSKGGLCLRLQEMLEVRSLVRLQLTSEGDGSMRGQRAVECTGRVAWVIQRLDLRTSPPFLYDVGIEFVDPPQVLRQLLAREGSEVRTPKKGTAHVRGIEPALIRGRHFTPHLQHDAPQPLRWHLVITVDGTPCFSGRYASEHAALAAWGKFKRQQARR